MASGGGWLDGRRRSFTFVGTRAFWRAFSSFHQPKLLPLHIIHIQSAHITLISIQLAVHPAAIYGVVPILLSPVWPLFRSPFGSRNCPLGRQFTILLAVSFSSLRKWTARTRITHGDSYCCLEAFYLSTLKLLPVWQNLYLLILFGFGLTNNGRRYQASWQLVPKQEGPPLS